MFSFSSYLVLGGDTPDSLSPAKIGLEIANCRYSFGQEVDEKGKPTTRTYTGPIHITLSQLPTPEITEWGLNSRRYKDGMIYLLDSNYIPLEKVVFKNAACVGFEMNYTRTGDSYISTKLVLQPEKLTVGDVIDFDSEWTE